MGSGDAICSWKMILQRALEFSYFSTHLGTQLATDVFHGLQTPGLASWGLGGRASGDGGD